MNTTQRFYRIASAKFRFDLSGKGAEILGGRFNPIGTPAVYAASSISLAMLETLVHTSNFYPLSHFIMALDIPADSMAKVERYSAADLPKSWGSIKDLTAAQQWGMQRLFGANRFGVLVPSVVTPEEHNLILNPAHADMRGVTISEVRALDLDERLK